MIIFFILESMILGKRRIKLNILGQFLKLNLFDYIRYGIFFCLICRIKLKVIIFATILI